MDTGLEPSAVSKILSFFGGDAPTIAITLANSLVGVVAQCLVPTVACKYTLAAEILVNDATVSELVNAMEFAKLNAYLQQGSSNSCTYCKTQGVALVNKICMLDLAARKARKIERASREVVDDAIGRLVALLD